MTPLIETLEDLQKYPPSATPQPPLYRRPLVRQRVYFLVYYTREYRVYSCGLCYFIRYFLMCLFWFVYYLVVWFFWLCGLSGLCLFWFCVLPGFSIFCIVVIFVIFNVKIVSVLGPKLSPKIRAKNGLFWVLIWLEPRAYRFTHLCLFVLKRSQQPIIP